MDTENPKTAIEYIHSLGRFSGKPGLHRIKALCEALGNPQDRLKFVHLEMCIRDRRGDEPWPHLHLPRHLL